MVKSVTEFKDYSNREDLKHLSELLENWLGMYTEEVIKRVMNRIDEVLASETTLELLEELYDREEAERSERRGDFYWITDYLADDKEGEAYSIIENIHNHCLTHSKSYRDVLYDRYIR